MEKIVLIDGHSILNRAFYGIPELTNAKGLHTNAIYGFLNIMFKILEEEQPQYLTVAFDVKQPTFRHELFTEYKGTRKPMPEELREQVPVMKEVLRSMGIQIVEKAGYEADDVLGTIAGICEKEGMQVSIISGDRDLLQLATDHIKIRIPKTKKTGTQIEDYLAAQVLETYQVTPKEFIDVKALMGDTADNIPGVPSIGEKTAIKLIVRYKSVQGVYENIDEIKAGKMKTMLEEYKEQAFLSRKLAEICTGCDVEFDLQQARIEDFYTEEAYRWFQELEFKNMLSRFKETEHTFSVSDYLTIVEELEEAEQVFAKAGKMQEIALHVVGKKEKLQTLVLAFGNKEKPEIFCVHVNDFSFLNSQYIWDKCMELCKTISRVIVGDVKFVLECFGESLEKDVWKNMLDTGLMAYLVNPLKSSYTYDELAKEYAGIFLPSGAELLGKMPVEEWLEKDTKKAEQYLGVFVYGLFQSADKLYDTLTELDMLSLYQDIELPLAVSLYRMEQAGIGVKKEVLEFYSKEIGEKVEQYKRTIYELAGEQFNINSPKQLGDILFEKLQLPYGKKTKTGYSTSAEVLDKLKDEHAIVNQVLEYRQLSKLKSTYTDGLVPYIMEDGKIHSTFNQTVTATGRISSTEPNLQNIPIRMELGRLIRKAFVPQAGNLFIDADYSQIELRVLAHMANDEKMIEAFNQGEDIHKITASQVFHIPPEEVTPLQRRNAKAVNFGIVYGISAFGLSQDLGISRKEAGEYIEKYFETYPRIKTFLEQLVADAGKNGYVSSLFNRKRPMPELKSSNYMTRSFGERVAMNAPIQGTAADIIKIAMVRVDQRLIRERMKARLILQVHDELLIEAPVEEEEQVKQILKEEMEQAVTLKVQLLVDMHSGTNWYQAK